MSVLPAGGDRPQEALADSRVSTMVPLDEPSRLGEARRVVNLAGVRAALDPGTLSNLGIMVNEITSNAFRHARGGFLIVRVLESGKRMGVELLCIDRGPGMTNIAESMRDGHSTAGSMGTGLGAARRIATTFDIFSMVGSGTVVLARLWSGGRVPSPAPALGNICLPHPGERQCGDGWGFAQAGGRTVLFSVDGLGHGPAAAEAAETATRIFRAHYALAPGEILDRVHRGLKSTRGAAAAVSEIDLGKRKVRHAGVGNISGWVLNDRSTRAMVSHNGILGHQVHRVQEFEYPLPPDALVVLHSDGLTNKWKPDAYPGLLRRDTAIVAGVIYRDSVRERDDSSIMVFRVPTSLDKADAVQS